MGKPSSAPSERLTVMMVATAGGFAFYGTILGALWLLGIWGYSVPLLDPAAFASHPYVQLYGFLTIFIMGVAYSLVPRFKNRALRPLMLAYLSFALALVGSVALAAKGFLTYSPMISLESLGDAALLLAATIFLYLIVKTLGRPHGELALSEPYIVYSAVILAGTLAAKLIRDVSAAPSPGVPSSIAFLQLSLLGFPAMMIFGVELRTIHFRAAGFRKLEARAAFLLFAVGGLMSLLSFLGVVNSVMLVLAVSLAHFIGGVLLVGSIRAYENTLTKPQITMMRERDRRGYEYLTLCLRLASGWLILGLAFEVMLAASYAATGNVIFGLRDSFVHAISVGFIGSTIVAYGPMLLPPLIVRRAPYRSLTLWPIILLTIGNGLRITGNTLLDTYGLTLRPVGFSGILLLLAMIYFVLMMRSLLREGKRKA